ncbi:MAG: tetratricopeptide repeat protein, partial [Alphaproteobacteria bacterium]|nr:tetratricopeptide repeat protein [Alphaproteobacteria bacterium]
MSKADAPGTQLSPPPNMTIPPAWQGLLGQAIMDHQNGQLDAAIATYKKAVKVIPAHPHLHYLLGTALIQQQKFAKAEASMRRAVELAGQNFEYLNNLASALMGQSKFPEAEAVLRLAMAISPDSMDVLANLGVVLGELGRWSEAMLPLSRVRLERPDMRKILRHLGVAYCIVKDWPRAIEIIEDYLTTEPKDDVARNNLAMAFRAINEREGMLETLKDLYENNPDNLAYLSNYYHHLVTFGRNQQALEVLDRYAKNNPMDITINGLLSRYHFRFGNIDQAYIHARLVQMVKEFNPLSYMDPLTIYPRVLDFDGFDSLGIDLEKFAQSSKDANSSMNVAFLSLLPMAWTDDECEALFQMHKNWGDRLLKLAKEEPGVAEIPALSPRNAEDKKLRIGFLSSDIR